MAMVGMNVQEVRELVRQLETSAKEIEQAMSAVTNKLGVTTWVGDDRNAFQGDWDSKAQPMLRQVAELLTGAAQAAGRNAAEQENASAGGTASF